MICLTLGEQILATISWIPIDAEYSATKNSHA